MVCLDTTFVIDLLRGRMEIESLKDEIEKSPRADYLNLKVQEV